MTQSKFEDKVYAACLLVAFVVWIVAIKGGI